MCTFVDKPTFSENWDEKLDNTINIFDTISMMFLVDEYQKLRAVPIMLSGVGLNYFGKNANNCD